MFIKNRTRQLTDKERKEIWDTTTVPEESYPLNSPEAIKKNDIFRQLQFDIKTIHLTALGLKSHERIQNQLYTLKEMQLLINETLKDMKQ
tara:strand:- start:360 stop:629 length:270 start_codon:yes stop_codon:yes gene_type:complete